MGLAHVLEDLVTEHVAAGRLVRVLEPWCPPMYRFHLYFPGTPRMPGQLRVFIDFLRTHSGHDARRPTLGVFHVKHKPARQAVHVSRETRKAGEFRLDYRMVELWCSCATYNSASPNFQCLHARRKPCCIQLISM
ncbi:hypothetical protein [uncultured Ralstonia sp.]